MIRVAVSCRTPDGLQIRKRKYYDFYLTKEHINQVICKDNEHLAEGEE